MSLDIQLQIRRNGEEVKEFVKDLGRWQNELKKKQNKYQLSASKEEQRKTSITTSEIENVCDHFCSTTDNRGTLKKTGCHSIESAYSHEEPGSTVNRTAQKQEIQQKSGPCLTETNKSAGLHDQRELTATLPIAPSLGYPPASMKMPNACEKPDIQQHTGRNISVRVHRQRGLLSCHPLLQEIEKQKVSAKELYSNRKIREALSVYNKAFEALNALQAESMDEESAQRSRTTRQSLLLNRAACNLRLQNYQDVIKDATLVLQFDIYSKTALMRRSLAHEKMGCLRESLSDLRAAMHSEQDIDALAVLKNRVTGIYEKIKTVQAVNRKALVQKPVRVTSFQRKMSVKHFPVSADYETAEAADLSISSINMTNLEVKEGMLTNTHNQTMEGMRLCGNEELVHQHAKQEITPSNASHRDLNASFQLTGKLMSYFKFKQLWYSKAFANGPKNRFKLLLLVGSEVIPKLFKESLDSDLISSIFQMFADVLVNSRDIIECIKGEGLVQLHPDCRYEEAAILYLLNILQSLSNCKRFALCIECLSAEETEGAKLLLQQASEWKSNETIREKVSEMSRLLNGTLDVDMKNVS